ncbi:MAG: hypothetical protein C4582_04760 [Desulfobacteraceae bacterium]|nr:MAG: hypothetical protein C4582_04760 [Desulfobacteraceae bacterium]
MAKMRSYTKYENKVIPGLRQNLNKAESTEDVKKFFVYAAKELLEGAFEGFIEVRYEDMALAPDSDPCFTISDRLLSLPEIKEIWRESDLSQVIGRLADSAVRRYRYLQKNPEKTEAKIRM